MPDYTTREMMDAIDQTPPVRTFLQKTFFPGEETHVTEKVEFDVRKGKRVMAPLVSPRVGGKVITRQGFHTNSFTTPKIAPERPLTVDDVSKRAIGENVYSQRTPEEREDELLSKDMTDLEEAIARRKEWMCRQILYEGKSTWWTRKKALTFRSISAFRTLLSWEPIRTGHLRPSIHFLPFARSERKSSRRPEKPRTLRSFLPT